MSTAKLAVRLSVINVADQGGGVFRVTGTTTDFRGNYFGTDVVGGMRLWAFDSNPTILDYVRWEIDDVISAIVNDIVVDVRLDPVPGGGDPVPPGGPGLDPLGAITDVVGEELLAVELSVADQSWSETLKTRVAEDNYRRMQAPGNDFSISKAAGAVQTLPFTSMFPEFSFVKPLGGIALSYGDDYTISGSTLTLAAPWDTAIPTGRQINGFAR